MNNCAICGKPESEHHAFVPEMTDDDELIQRAHGTAVKALRFHVKHWWDRDRTAHVSMSVWTLHEIMVFLDDLLRAVDERDELQKMLRDFCSNQEASAAEMTATIARLRKRVAELETDDELIRRARDELREPPTESYVQGVPDHCDRIVWRNAYYSLPLTAETEQLRKRVEELERARPIDEWHEDIGPVLWWRFPVEEPPYCGTPLDTDWPEYHTHWSPIVVPDCGAELEAHKP